MSAPVKHSSTEAHRLLALEALDVGDGVRDEALDHAVELASTLFRTPIALVSLVGHTTQTFQARKGVDVCGSSREVSFCSHAVAQRTMLVVEDASADPRFADNPLVTGAPGVRFYAGAPMITRSGHAVGALCVIDTQPRPALDTREQALLRGLADLAVAHLERRRLSAAQRAAVRLTAATSDAMIIADAEGAITFWNDAAQELLGYAPSEAVGAPLELIVPEDQRLAHRAGFSRLANGGPAKLGRIVELQARRRDGSSVPVEMSLSHWRDQDGVHFAAVIRDVRERLRAEAELHQLTHFDGLTGLPNRVAFLRAIDELIRERRPFSVLKIGIDGFKALNESRGLPTGDAVLQEAGRRVVLASGGEAFTARLGGDELGVLLTGRDDPLEATLCAERVLAALGEPFVVDDGETRLSASVGMVLSPGLARPASAHEALKQGLLAMQAAKREGGARHRLFSLRMSQEAEERRVLDEALRAAARRGEFELHYQPQVRLSDGALVGAEALLRWRRPGFGLVGPAAFLLQLERSDLALEVGRWILEEACRFGAELAVAGAPIRMGVNLFSGQLRSAALEAEVKTALRISGLPPTHLELEITETTVLGADKTVLSGLKSLRRRGVGLAFDDYGTGYASLSLLKLYPVSRLKIDREFVRKLGANRADGSIVRAVLALGSSLGLEVIAEGVETVAQASFLQELGCGEAQGYLYGRPLTGPEFRTMTGIDAVKALEPEASRRVVAA